MEDDVFDDAGNVVTTTPSNAIANTLGYVSQTPSGGFLDSAGGYIYFYDSSGAPLASTSSSVPVFGYGGPSGGAGSPFSFATGAGGAVEVGSHVFYDDGGVGIVEFSTTGVLEGIAPGSALGQTTGGSSPLWYDSASGDLYYLTNTYSSAGVASIPLSSVEQLITAPAPPIQGGFGDALGVGAGLTTPVTANYFAPGSSASVNAIFDPWWKNYPDPLSLSYWIASGDQVTAKQVPTATTVPLSWSGVSSGNSLTVPLSLSAIDQEPGTYLVNADLVDNSTGTTIGATCLTYSVGATGDSLNFSTLPGGPDYGGPSFSRGVELAAELGTGLFRQQLQLATLLPNCSSASPSAATCGPSALTNWSSYDPATEQAASLAKSLGMNFELQIGQTGAAVDTALVNNNYWQEDVQAIIEHFATSAPDLKYFEVWNEPNDQWSAASYVSNVLQPFYAAAQAANAADGTSVQVIGGTVVGEDLSYWTTIAQNGGFADMNIAAIHPYPGYDRSFEEQGTPAFLGSLRNLMSQHGASSMPVWDTEQGWWSDGEQAFYDVGNWAPREWMWLRSFGITNWNYFITEGEFNGVGTDYSLIEAAGADYYVKPGALGLMTVSRLLGDRPFVKQVSLGIPHAYGMLFGPSSSSNTDVLAVWTDDLRVPADVTTTSSSSVTVSTIESLGAAGSLSTSSSSPAPISLSGAPLYLTFPATASVSVTAAESFGTNLALASNGATATASSSQGGVNVPSAVIAGNDNAEDNGGMSSTPAWAAAQSDTSPWIQVTLPNAVTVDRVIVSTSSIGSVAPGLRDYSVEAEVGGNWTRVGSVTNEFFDRMEQISFAPVQNVTAIKILPTALDYNGTVGGLPPAYWTSGFPDYPFIYSVEVYAPGIGTSGASGASSTGATPGANGSSGAGSAAPSPAAGQASGTSGIIAPTGPPATTIPLSTQPTQAKSKPNVGIAPSTTYTTTLSVETPTATATSAAFTIAAMLVGPHGTPTGVVAVQAGATRVCTGHLATGALQCRLPMTRAPKCGGSTGCTLRLIYEGDADYQPRAFVLALKESDGRLRARVTGVLAHALYTPYISAETVGPVAKRVLTFRLHGAFGAPRGIVTVRRGNRVICAHMLRSRAAPVRCAIGRLAAGQRARLIVLYRGGSIYAMRKYVVTVVGARTTRQLPTTCAHALTHSAARESSRGVRRWRQ